MSASSTLRFVIAVEGVKGKGRGDSSCDMVAILNFFLYRRPIFGREDEKNQAESKIVNSA